MKYSLTKTLTREPRAAHNNRRYMRVGAYGLLSCFCNKNGNQYAVNSISLGGMLLEGDATFNCGNTYRFSVVELQKITGISITLNGLVLRVKDHLVAVKFTRMDTRNFENLKTALIYIARYPVMISEEFPSEFSMLKSNQCQPGNDKRLKA